VSVSYDQTVTATGLLEDGPVTHNHLTLFDDNYWGSSVTETTMTQSMFFNSRGEDGLLILGQLNPNSTRVRSLRPSNLGANALAQGNTYSSFEFLFSVGSSMPWNIGIDATRNPSAAFACTLRNVTTNGLVYFSPLSTPSTGTGSGVLAAGTYRFVVSQNTFALTGASEVIDSSTASFFIRIGTPPPCDPDFNCDGNTDQDDVSCLINVVAGSPGCECADPDFNADGNVDQDDVTALINVIAGGGCP